MIDFVSHQDKVRTVRYLLVRENDGWKSTTSSPAAGRMARQKAHSRLAENNGPGQGAAARLYPGEPTYATRIILVAPGVPSGTPATMMMRCPALAKLSRNAIWQARSTMSS